MHTAGARLRDDVGNECAEFFLVHLFWQESLDYRDFVGFDGCKIVSARIFVLALSVLALLQHFVEYGEDIVITKLSTLVYL